MNLIQVAVLVIVFGAFVNAQTVRSGNQKPRKSGTDAELQQRRDTALSLLQSLAVEARSYTDEPLRARVQAQIADAIWSHDRESARTLFRRAWDVAEAVDQAAATANAAGRRPNNGVRSNPEQIFVVRFSNLHPAATRLWVRSF